ncbi:site-specific DNA-methyltransferase [Curtobacterium sp. MCLR17_044]|uniref:site-specific DNA-methyltransferase n=1 Tax=Curtobacterium sp. MCLR17_044 TaxID=2175628 RepID=UPI0011B561DE|nr:site-specific DNA-methyltransferase [Curtobacterium sp. MCLR17_044]
MTQDYVRWTGARNPRWLATNFKSPTLPFQGWQKFKEAFAPEVVARAIRESPNDVRTIVDPFGGSGTSALTAQFLGCKPITSEVNPYLADVIEAKLTSYNLNKLKLAVKDFSQFAQKVSDFAPTADIGNLPRTFVEPGKNERWLFSRELYDFLQALISHTLRYDPAERRLLQTSIGGDLLSISNARVSGKGRRYRSNWSSRQTTRQEALATVLSSVEDATGDIATHGNRPEPSFRLIRGDSRQTITEIDQTDLVIFSPPYPNSFDYTDVYNIELWMLGYLDKQKNQDLRKSTLSSHVQIFRNFEAAPTESKVLNDTLNGLTASEVRLWSNHIPAMIGGYFADMLLIMTNSRNLLPSKGQLWMVVGDSRYAGIDIPVADILVELALASNWQVAQVEPLRSMRTAPQQGGRAELPESLIVLQKP